MKNLVFTSAGDNTNFDKLWLDDNREYDVWVTYYGDDDSRYKRYKSKVDYISKRKGFKFQNFHHLYKTKRKEIDKYDRFWIVDDDIVMSTNDINKMFKMAETYGFWICGPTFDKKSKISHTVTKHVPGLAFRYTNYVEVNVPCMSKQALDNLMEIFNPELIGWGIETFYIWANGWRDRTKYALIDDIQCTNPKDIYKSGGRRELTRGKDWDIREAIFKKHAKKLGIPRIRRRWYSRHTWEELQGVKPPSESIKHTDTLNLIESQKDKIAFMFLTCGNLTQPQLIYEFLSDGADRSTMYSHIKNPDSVNQKFLLDSQISKKVYTEWGKIGLVNATNCLLEEALKDPTNKYFVLMSESCIPMYSFNHIYETITSVGKSWINRIHTNRPNYLKKKFNHLLKPGEINILKAKDLKLCNQWMVLTRDHAELLMKHDYTKTVFRDAHIPDESYYINVLTYHDKNFNKTVVSRRLTAAKMQYKHPRKYKRLTDVQLDMLREFEKGNCLFARKISEEANILYNQINKNEKSNTSRKKDTSKTARNPRNILKHRNIHSRVTSRKRM